MKKLLSFLAALVVIPSLAFGGTSFPPGVQVSGGVTAGHVATFFNSNTIQDGGAPTGIPGGTSGQIEYNNAGAFGGFTMSGDCTVVTSTGVITCTKTNGTAFTTAATTALGTSGATLGLLNSNLTFGGTDTFSNAPTITPFSVAGFVTNTAAGLLGSVSTVNLSTQASGTLQAAQEPAHTGDVTNTAGSLATTVAKIAGTTVSGTTGSGSVVFGTSPTINGKTITNPVITSVTRTVITTSGTWNAPAGLVFADVECVGGGGGSGGVAWTSGSAVSGAGGGGGYARKLFTAATLGSSQTVTIGAGGAAGAAGANNGGSGGNTTFGALLTCNGGSRGSGIGSNTCTACVGGAGGAGGTATGGDINIAGTVGQMGYVFGAVSQGICFIGGSTPFYPGGGSTAACGYAPIANSGGGGGNQYTATAATAGVAGAAGQVVVTAYISN